jgi:hypothetical protein
MGSLRDIQRTEAGINNSPPVNITSNKKLLIYYERARLVQEKSSFRLSSVKSFNPIFDEVYEDVTVYEIAPSHFIIKGQYRSYTNKAFGEIPIDKVADMEIEEVIKRKYWFFGPKITVKKLRGDRYSWVALKETQEREFEIIGTLLLEK